MIKNNGKQYKIKSGLVWDDKKDMELKQLKKAERSICQIAMVFHCSEAIIHRRLRVLNLTENKWTPIQDGILEKHYLTKTNQELADMLNINVVYIADRLAYLCFGRQRGRRARQK